MTPELLPDGIYLDLSFEDYLAQPRLSSGSITRLMEGPSDFWADSWMNPDREEQEETGAMTLGRAYHCARLEPEKFHDLYCEELDPETLGPDLLTTSTQVGDRLAELGQTKKKAGELAAEQAQRLLAADPEAKILSVELLKWESEIKGDRTAIASKAWKEIQRDAARVRMNPELAGLLERGVAEVSILWTEPETGARCKIRPDYLGSHWITHLKTWDMKAAGKPGNRAIADAFRFNGYYRTGWFYHMGLDRIARDALDLRHPDGTLCGPVIPTIVSEWQNGSAFSTWFLFVRRAGIPDVRARRVAWFDLPPGVEEQSINASTDRFPRTASAVARKADLEIMSCLRSYAESCEIYGTEGDPWFPRDMMGVFEDADFSSYWLDSLDDPR